MIDFGARKDVDHLDCPIDASEFASFESRFAPLVAGGDPVYPLIPGAETWPFVPPTREKLLEYYLTWKALDFGPRQSYLDVASCLSLFPNFIAETTRSRVIRQDLYYSPGRHAVKYPRILTASWFRKTVRIESIGCDAAQLPFPDNSIDNMGLHCSFEHFEGDADTRFVREAFRVLRPGGRVFIIPFYCGLEYSEIRKYDYSEGCQFQRYYHPSSFEERVLDPLGSPVRIEIRYYPNQKEIDEAFYCYYSIALVKP